MAIRLALRKSAVVTTLTRTTGLRMIHLRDWLKAARAVTCIACITGRRMIARLAFRSDSVMAG